MRTASHSIALVQVSVVRVKVTGGGDGSETKVKPGQAVGGSGWSSVTLDFVSWSHWKQSAITEREITRIPVLEEPLGASAQKTVISPEWFRADTPAQTNKDLSRCRRHRHRHRLQQSDDHITALTFEAASRQVGPKLIAQPGHYHP